MHEYSQGICQDGAAILKDGVPMTIEEILEALHKLAAAEARVSEVEKYNLGLATESHHLQERVRVLREALDAISDSDPDASAGLLRDIANEALATTEDV